MKTFGWMVAIGGASVVIFYGLHTLRRWWQGGESKGWKKDGEGE